MNCTDGKGVICEDEGTYQLENVDLEKLDKPLLCQFHAIGTINEAGVKLGVVWVARKVGRRHDGKAGI